MKSKLIRYGVAMLKSSRQKPRATKQKSLNGLAQPFRIMLHPICGFSDMKYEKNASVTAACLILLFWFFSEIFKYLETGFLFTTSRAEDLNIKLIFMSTVAVALFWVISNWAVTTLIDGEGNFREIFTYTCYAMLPRALFSIPVAVISKVLISNEGMFISLADTVTFLWMLLILFLGNMIMHQFSFKKNIISILLTVCGILILLLIVVLGFSLVLQMESFVSTVYQELFHRV